MFKKLHSVMASMAMPPVLAAHHSNSINSKTVLAAYSCKCGTHVVQNRLHSPSCVTCSEVITLDQNLDDKENNLTFNKQEMLSLPIVANCTTCNSTIRSTTETAKALKGRNGHCIVCSSVIAFSMEETDDMEDSEEEGMDTSDSEDMEEDVEDDSSMEEDLEDDDSEEEEEDEEDTTSVVAEEEEDDTGVLDDKDPTDFNEPENGESTEEEKPEDALTDDVKVEEPEIPVESSVKKVVTASAFDKVLKAEASANIELLLSSNSTRWYMLANDKHIATATIERANDQIKKIFPSEDFIKTLQIATELGMTEEAIKPFGFEPVTLDITVDDAADQKVEQAVEVATAALNNKLATLTESFNQCVGIASVGINKGVFAEVSNPLRAAFIERMAELNIRAPEKVVDTVLAAHGEDMLRCVVAKALDLLNKPTEVLNEVGKMVAEASYRANVHNLDEDGRQNGSVIVPFMARQEEPHSVESGAAYGTPANKTVDLVRSIGRRF